MNAVETLWSRSLAREAWVTAAAGALFAALVLWLLPAGTDFAAHAYQRALFLRHGFVLWDNFWYAGRYSFVTYSLLYYPLAAVLGIRPLALATVVIAALAFAVVLGRQWGVAARWSSRSFPLVWVGVLLSAAFPFALGVALALLALVAIQRGHRRSFTVLAALTLGASPLAFLLLAVALGATALGSRIPTRRLVGPIATIALSAAAYACLWLAFPAPGRFPFALVDLLGTIGACLVGAAATFRIARARPLFWFFLVYAAVSLAAYAIPSELGANVARIRFISFPLALLVAALRKWRPLRATVLIAVLAFAWNIDPILRNLASSHDDPEASPAYWRPAVSFLRHHADPSFRVEAVDTDLHSPALYLAGAGIPLARGWFRQDDFPANDILYSRRLTPVAYRQWLRSLAVRFVVLSAAPPDYSSRLEARLLRSGRSGLPRVFEDDHLTIYEVPHARPMVSGRRAAHILSLTDEHVVIALSARGTYRIAIRYSPYWRTSSGCLTHDRNGMLELRATRPGVIALSFDVDPATVTASLAGAPPPCPPSR